MNCVKTIFFDIKGHFETPGFEISRADCILFIGVGRFRILGAKVYNIGGGGRGGIFPAGT